MFDYKSIVINLKDNKGKGKLLSLIKRKNILIIKRDCNLIFFTDKKGFDYILELLYEEATDENKYVNERYIIDDAFYLDPEEEISFSSISDFIREAGIDLDGDIYVNVVNKHYLRVSDLPY